ncbi:unnamed protein product [Alopecurus aequalis]
MEELRDMELLLRAATLFAGGTASLSHDVSKATLPITAAQMARMANEIAIAADNTGVSTVELISAAEELSHVDGVGRSEAVSGLIHACVTFAHDAVHVELDNLMHRAIDLALAGRCYLRLAALGSTEGPAASQPNHNPEEEIGVGHAAWWARKRKVTDLEEPLLLKPSPANNTSVPVNSSSSKESKGVESDSWAGIHLFCLGGSLSLLPYLGTDGLLADKDFSDDYRWWVSIVLMLWWCLVSFGVTCSLFGRSSFELHYARFSSYLGIFGISILVMMFLHWALAIKSMAFFYGLLGVAAVIFLIHWIWCCYQRDK